MRTKHDDTTRLLSLGAMASRLGLHPKELRAEADAEGVPCVRVGKRGLLFDPQLVTARLAARAHAMPPHEERRGRDATS